MAALSLTVEESQTDLAASRSQLEESKVQLKSVSAELETARGQVESLTEQTIAQEKKATDLSGLLSNFKDKLRNDREQGAASLSGLTEKMQLELQTAKEEHDLRDAEKSKTIANTQKELLDTKARLADVLTESSTHSKKSEEASRQVVQLTSELVAAEECEAARAVEVARLEATVASTQTVSSKHYAVHVQALSFYMSIYFMNSTYCMPSLPYLILHAIDSLSPLPCLSSLRLYPPQDLSSMI